MKLQHFGHEHPLIFNEDREKNNYEVHPVDNFCHMCLKQVSGPNYSCKECCQFRLHQSCAELPRKLHHPLHPKHPLLLIHVSQKRGGKCEGCKRDHLLSFVYSCVDCNFNLDNKCASLPLIIQADNHDHSLTLMRKSVSFTCDACGKEGKGMFYLCHVCAFLVHVQCASFPLIVKLIRHSHPLTLTNSLQVNEFCQRLCLLCVKNVDTDYMFYYCSTCDFITHLHCATNERLWDETFVPKFKDSGPIESTSMQNCQDPGLDIESIDSFTYAILKSEVGEDKIEKAVEIKHFSHEHDLKLIDEQHENNEKCNACMWPTDPPFYSCAKCIFFLHKSCVELPRKKSHPLHQHPLILLPEPPYDGMCFVCDACNRSCNGFSYNCDKCMFDLDVRCSLMSDIITHQGHDHQFILSSASYYDKCTSCDSKGQIFRCADCEFTLDFKCATLPHTTRYRPHEQLFTLIYKDEDNPGDEHYCDICEKERDPKHSFYYCADLDFPAHPDCILGRFPYINFGRTCTFEIHEHPLTLVNKKDVYPQSLESGAVRYDLIFECVTCNFSHTVEIISNVWQSKRHAT
ncbi:uncharacterized protein LOC132185576 [Corylus avellana]|uniref:uncharacterized protein LOC132185576 n=1 Tax=Corylus avellana TaxID=13451 RepID=UPI00286C1485|nr:uncharacterized protein LOC132185576 [Corylus avellana]